MLSCLCSWGHGWKFDIDLGFTWCWHFDYVNVYLEDIHVGDGFYDAMVTQYHGWVRVLCIDIFIECLQMLEVYLRSCCCRSAFDICMVHFVFFMVCGDGSSWYVEMVFSSWCVEMVSSWGLIGFLVKVWFMHFILGVRMVSFLCHGILLIRV